jgi:hypothetical protein
MKVKINDEKLENEMIDSSIVKFQKHYGFSSSLYVLLVEIL